MAARPHGWMHGLFRGGIALKGLMGLTEGLVGAALWLAPPGGLHRLAARAADSSVLRDLHGGVVAKMLHAAQTLPAGAQHFYAFYLLLHGVLKLVMVSLLWAKLPFAWPAALVIQSAFIAIELGRWAATRNPALLGLAVLDAAIIWLIWQEWRAARRRVGA